MIKDVDYIIGFDFGHGETSVSMVDVGGLDCKAANIETKDLYINGSLKFEITAKRLYAASQRVL